MELRPVSGIAFSRDEAKITLFTIEDRPGIAAAIFGPLADAGVNVDMIVQNVSEKDYDEAHPGAVTDMTFSCPIDQVPRAKRAMEEAQAAGRIRYDELIIDDDVAKVSVVGIGMRSHAGVAATMFKALAAEGINIKVITTSEIKISVLIDRKYMELAVQALHDAFGLDRAA
jgi:aspartate kinase